MNEEKKRTKTNDKKENNEKKYATTTTKYTAVLIEPRKHKAFQFVLNNFLTNLNEDWGFVLFHGTENENYVKMLISLYFANFEHKIQLINMQKSNLTIKEYNVMLCSPEMYEHIPTEIFLIFQMDTCIWPKYKDYINDFLQFDYVGAPWHPDWVEEPLKQEVIKYNNVGNGGLSLRKKSKMLEIIRVSETNNGDINEDLFFSFPTKCSINKAPFYMAKKFAIESIFNHECFGVHKVWFNVRQHELIYLLIHFPELQELMYLNTNIRFVLDMIENK